MNNLKFQAKKIFSNSLKSIIESSDLTSRTLNSESLATVVNSNSDLYSSNLVEFSKAFNSLLGKSNSNTNSIEAFVTENDTIFHNVESIFQHYEWKSNEKIENFNFATRNTSISKCTEDNEFYIIKCYEYFYYVYNTKTNQCLIVIKKESKALTMINILLLTPYLLYGDLYAVHGGLVSNGKKNVLINNSSLGGKTTFALLFLINGWQIITEETTYITPKGEILNFNIRNYFNIRVGTYLEFKDFFIKMNIINDDFLNMSHLDKKELFKLGKKEQISIDFNLLCKNAELDITKTLTHTLKVSLDEDKIGMSIKKIPCSENVDAFLELSLAPTVLLFSNLISVPNLNKDKRKSELSNIFQNVQSYSVASGFDYKENFNNLTNKVGV